MKVSNTKRKKIKFLELEKNETFQVFFGTGKKGVTLVPQTINNDCFFLVQSGSILLQIGNSEHYMSKDICINVKKDTIHSFEILDDCEILWVLNTTSIVNNLIS